MGSKSTKTTTVYGKTKTSNPYAYSQSNNKGTTAAFKEGTALKSVYDFVNKNTDALLNEYLNPTLNSVTNQAKLNTFAKNLSQQTRNNIENNIISPLSNRNMIRSSQANDLYKNLTNQNVAAISDFVSNLLSSSQTDTAKMLSNLLSYYMLGANYLNGMQNHSLQASSGNATKQTTSGGSIAEDVANLAIATMMATT